jgi:UMP-CMP kinase
VETLPIAELFKSKGRCVEIDTSLDRQAVYALVVDSLAEHTDRTCAARPRSERAEMLLGLRPYPKKV